MKNYSVLLLYPLEYTDGEIETWFTHVKALQPDAAVCVAQAEAFQNVFDGWSDDAHQHLYFYPKKADKNAYTLSDFHPLLVIEGHHEMSNFAVGSIL